MNTQARRGSLLPWLSTLALLAAVAYGWGGGGPAAAAGPAAQDVSRVEMRVNLLEQRFRSVEMSLIRLEQQSRLPAMTPGANARDAEAALLRTEVEALRRRLAEAECGLLRLDERTLTPAAREARREAGVGETEPCRLTPAAPLRLSTRP
jgi:hypothetical protein